MREIKNTQLRNYLLFFHFYLFAAPNELYKSEIMEKIALKKKDTYG
jgi:hypothetical protein